MRTAPRRLGACTQRRRSALCVSRTCCQAPWCHAACGASARPPCWRAAATSQPRLKTPTRRWQRRVARALAGTSSPTPVSRSYSRSWTRSPGTGRRAPPGRRAALGISRPRQRPSEGGLCAARAVRRRRALGCDAGPSVRDPKLSFFARRKRRARVWRARAPRSGFGRLWRGQRSRRESACCGQDTSPQKTQAQNLPNGKRHLDGTRGWQLPRPPFFYNSNPAAPATNAALERAPIALRAPPAAGRRRTRIARLHVTSLLAAPRALSAAPDAFFHSSLQRRTYHASLRGWRLGPSLPT